MRLRYSIRLDPSTAGDGGGYIAYCPDFPLNISAPTATGPTTAEALAAFEKAMDEWLAAPGLFERHPYLRLIKDALDE